jgi:hypothetical protein
MADRKARMAGNEPIVARLSNVASLLPKLDGLT